MELTSELEHVEGGALAALGFRGAAMHCGVKATPVPDLVLLVSDVPASAAATITRNRFRAAPTYVTQQHVADGRAQAIVANSGNANCATGSQGLRNARRMAELTASALGLQTRDVLVCSTGVIGFQLPMDRIEPGIGELAGRLGREEPEALARGIMTTDSFPKLAAVAFDVDGTTVRVGGIAKGAGMICPNMATMLAFLTTDLAVDSAVLRDALRWAVDRSFNCIAVDGCMSTNDTVIALANGAAEATPVTTAASPQARAFRTALLAVCQELARMIASDGEGASKLIEVVVEGARSFAQARRAARAIATYDLLKIALHGGQFNWGRLAAALGSSLVAMDPSQTTMEMAGICVWRAGEPCAFDAQQAAAAVAGDVVTIRVDLGQGTASARAWTCDMSEKFVRENAGYEGPPEEQAEER